MHQGILVCLAVSSVCCVSVRVFGCQAVSVGDSHTFVQWRTRALVVYW